MTASIAYLPRDLTGASSANLITTEYHQTTPGVKSALRPNYGSYYSSTLQVYSVDGTNTLGLLTHGVDYLYSELDRPATVASGKDVYNLITILNVSLGSIFSITYQGYGGDSNINIADLYSRAQLAGLGVATPYTGLTNVPPLFTPISHAHDIADVYGMENLVSFVTNVGSAVTSNTTGAKNAPVTSAIQTFATAIENKNNGLSAAIRSHIDNTAYPHNDTAASVGLGNVKNYAFTPITLNGTPLPVYASPATVKANILSPPAYTANNHPYLRNNPHNDTAASVGLGNVANLSIVTNYTLNANQYVGLYASNAVPQYLAPYPLTKSVDEMAQAVYGQSFSTVISSVIATATNTLAQANSTLATVSNIQAAVNGTNNALVTSQASITLNANQSRQLGKQYEIAYANAAQSAVLEQVMLYDYANASTHSSVTPSGYYPLPLEIANLELWISANHAGNELFPDMNGNLRVTKLVDLSPNARVYSTNIASTAPLYTQSADRTLGMPGMTNAYVMKFSNGLCLDQTAGIPVRIVPGMTVIMLVRTGAALSQLAVLTNPLATVPVGIYAQTSTNQQLTIATGDAWRPLETPINTAAPQRTNLVVGVVSGSSEQYNWLASSTALDIAHFPRGTSTPASTFPTGTYTGAALTRIGNSNFAIANAGEIADVLIYNRALSAPEVRAIVAYLRLRYSKNTAIAADYSSLNAFNFTV